MTSFAADPRLSTPTRDTAICDQYMLPVANPQVVFCEVEGGAVLLSTESEVYFGLNEVGCQVWRLLPPRHQTLRQLCDELLELFPDAPADEVAQDVRELLDDLKHHGLVTEAA